MLNNLYLFLICCYLFMFFYKHLLLTLISLEFMMISMIFNMYMLMILIKINLFFITIFISIIVCESIIGLSLLIYLVRLTGNDYLNNLILMKC